MPVVTYSLLRLALFVVCLVVLVLAGTGWLFGVIIAAVIAAHYRGVQPTVRGRGTRQGPRREALRKGYDYAARNLVALLAECTADSRYATDDVCDGLDRLALEVRAARGECRCAGDLWDALARLPHKQRLAVAYHYLAGLPYREIAEITGGTTDAARRAAADGVKALRATYPLEGAHS